MSRTAAAPSEIWDAFPAWMEPSLAKAGLIFDKLSAVMPGLTPSSFETVMVLTSSVLGSSHLTVRGAISSSKRPLSWALRAFWYEEAAKASWTEREMLRSLAIFSDRRPMGTLQFLDSGCDSRSSENSVTAPGLYHPHVSI